jgi:hypothetical protein
VVGTLPACEGDDHATRRVLQYLDELKRARALGAGVKRDLFIL